MKLTGIDVPPEVGLMSHPGGETGMETAMDAVAPLVHVTGALLAAGLLVLASGAAQEDERLPWEDAEPDVVREDLSVPVDLEIAPDGTYWWNAFDTGNVTSWHPEDNRTRVHFHVDPYENPVERGLVGLELAPNVVDDGAFYVYYTVPNPGDPERETNHLSRVVDGEEERLLELPGHKRHNGGAIEMDEHERLFVAVGDNDQGYPAQYMDERIGKILHVDPDGSPANDTMEGAIYSLGHRNPFGLAYDETTGRLFATENSAQQRDEVNLIEPGENYGWPHCQGSLQYDPEERRQLEEPCPDEYRDPIGEFHSNSTAAPTGAAIHDGTLYWASLNQGQIHRMQRTDDGAWVDRVVFETDAQLLDLESHEGDLYFTDWSSIKRIPDPPEPGPAALPGEGEASLEEETDARSPIPAPAGLAPLLLAGAALARARGWR